MSARARAAAGALTLLVALAAAAPAQAGQFVYERGAAGVWAVGEDGSGAHRLVDLSQVPGMSEIDGVSMRPGGTDVAFVAGWSGARDEERRWDPFAVGYCGDGCLGYYELRGGTLRRMTEGPKPCPVAQPCRITEADARVAADGSVAFSYDATFASQPFPGGDWFAGSAESEPRLRAAGGGATTKVASPCAEPDTTLDRPAPNPANPREVLYRGCQHYDGTVFVDELARSGPDPADPGDDVGILTDDGTFVGYDWRPDGAQVAFTDSGSSRNGLWIADLGDPTQPAASLAYALASPGGTTFFSPRYVGADRIAFVARGDIWIVPASCRATTCSFPADARRVTAVGDVGPAIGYTSSAASIRAAGGGAHGRVPARLSVKRAAISHGRLHVRATIARAADGDHVRIEVRAGGRRVRFAVRVRHGRVRADRRLDGRGRVLVLTYPGSPRVSAAHTRVRLR